MKKIEGILHRRRLLVGASAAGILASAPAWIRTAFAEEATCMKSLKSLAALGGAFRRAHDAGKRLLVLVIPEADDTKYERGSLFGAWLNHATDAQLAPLSRCELACATMADLRRLVPGAPAGEPLMVLVDPSALGRPAVAIEPSLPAPDGREVVGGDDTDFEVVFRERQRREDLQWTARIAAVSRAVRDAVAPGAFFHDVTGLAAEVRRRWVTGKVPGSRWAQSEGCAITLEDEESNLALMCGMGSVPAKARRFLYLFSRSPDADLEKVAP